MRGIICSLGNSEDYATNETYRKIVKRKAFIAGVIMVLGAATIAADLVAQFLLGPEMNDFRKGFFSGAGTGLFFGGAILMIKRIAMLKSEDKLKKARIEESDERNRKIADIAMRIATVILLAAMYVAMIVSGFIMPEMMKLLSFLVCFFLLAYVGAYKILQRKM